MLDVNEAARVAGRSPETVRRWVWSGKLAAQRRGRRLMVSRDDLSAHIADHNRAEASLTLAEWAAGARRPFVASGGPARGSAADFVLAARHHRSEAPARPCPWWPPASLWTWWPPAPIPPRRLW